MALSKWFVMYIQRYNQRNATSSLPPLARGVTSCRGRNNAPHSKLQSINTRNGEKSLQALRTAIHLPGIEQLVSVMTTVKMVQFNYVLGNNSPLRRPFLYCCFNSTWCLCCNQELWLFFNIYSSHFIVRGKINEYALVIILITLVWSNGAKLISFSTNDQFWYIYRKFVFYFYHILISVKFVNQRCRKFPSIVIVLNAMVICPWNSSQQIRWCVFMD